MLLGNWSLVGMLLALPAVLMGLVVHELAHALVATWQGDPTPRLAGRLSLAPQAHLDPLGTIMFIVAGFGWAKPVPISPWRMRWGKWGEVLTAVAGPLANLSLAFLCALAGAWLTIRGDDGGLLGQGVSEAFSLNLAFGLFNLIPFPPLDGATILGGFLSRRGEAIMTGLNNYGGIILMVLLLSGFFWRLFGPVFSAVGTLWETGAWKLMGVFLGGSG